MSLRVGTRGSELAVTQTRQSLGALELARPGLNWELVKVSTTGDRIRDKPLREAGGKGLFVKELDEALLGGDIDCAVHSLKDVPSSLHDAISVVAVFERQSPCDVFISRNANSIQDLGEGAVLGTTSPRRAAQALAINPHLKTVLLRGNVSTRLAKVIDGSVDATFLARAGLNRLGLDTGSLVAADVDPKVFVPAVGQGAVVVTARRDDDETRDLFSVVDHMDTRLAVACERAFARVFGGGCHLPVGAYAAIDNGNMALEGLVAAPDGSRVLRSGSSGPAGDGEKLGERLAHVLLDKGAGEILAQVQVF